MSGKLPKMTGEDAIRALMRAGFVVVRIRGSHHFMQHRDSRTTMLPVHAGESSGLAS